MHWLLSGIAADPVSIRIVLTRCLGSVFPQRVQPLVMKVQARVLKQVGKVTTKTLEFTLKEA